VLAWAGAHAPSELSERLRVSAVEVGSPRPEGLPDGIAWLGEVPEDVSGLVVANELLDNVVFDVVEVDADGKPRLLEVDPATGAERPGPAPDAQAAAWLERWWPLDAAEPGARAEVGDERDAAWRNVVGRVTRGLAVAVDYAHERDRRPEFGTVTAYRGGHQVPAVPDGSCDVTAHVALDACAAAASGLEGVRVLLTTQREALRALGVSGARPPLTMASTDPVGYVRALSGASAAAELTEASGLGGFGWLACGVGVDPVMVVGQEESSGEPGYKGPM
jgi:SAM-dependent MidA family methyltransferase